MRYLRDLYIDLKEDLMNYKTQQQKLKCLWYTACHWKNWRYIRHQYHRQKITYKCKERICATARSARPCLYKPGPLLQESCSRRGPKRGTRAPPCASGCSCRPSGCLSTHYYRAPSLLRLPSSNSINTLRLNNKPAFASADRDYDVTVVFQHIFMTYNYI